MKKHILHAAGFLLGLVLLVQGLGLVFQPKDNTKEAGFRYSTGVGFLSEPENTLDVVFLGDSRVFYGLIPLEIWQDHGITSYVCGTPAEYLTDTYTTLEQFLERQDPKVVVLETNAIYMQPCYTTKILAHEAQQMFPLLKFHDRWKSLKWEDFVSPVDYRTVQQDKGYQYDPRVMAVEPNDHMAPSQDVWPPSSTNIRYIRRIWELCRQEGARLVLFTVPTTQNWFMANHNAMVQLAEEMGIDYLDMNTGDHGVVMDWERDTSDQGDHLNYTGAAKITAYMGSWLWETGLFSDKREDPVYAPWNACLEGFRAELARDGQNENQ